jgi:hypothetical protein
MTTLRSRINKLFKKKVMTAKAEVIRENKIVNTIGDFNLYSDKDVLLYSCKTVELAWKNNEPQVSCIPNGIYTVSICNPTDRIKYRHLWIQNVPNRAGIKIHIANFSYQLRGCIAVGTSHADMNKDGIIDVVSSTKALNDLLAVMDKNECTEFILEISTK